MRNKPRTLAELCFIASKYSSPLEFRSADPLSFDAMRKRTSVYRFFSEIYPKDEVEETAPQKEREKYVINPRPSSFLLQFYWHTAQPSAAELSEG
jgi:hypothetical protein